MEISATEFKARCLELLDQVQMTGEPITVIKRGRPVACLVPVEHNDIPVLFGCLKGSVTVIGDLMAEIDLEWDAVGYTVEPA